MWFHLPRHLLVYLILLRLVQINFGTALTTGLLYIGKFILGDQSIQALVNSTTTNLLTNLTTGSINFGTGLTTGILNMSMGKFIFSGQSIEALVNSTATSIFTNLTNLLSIGGLSNILLGSSSAGRVTQIQGETLNLCEKSFCTKCSGSEAR